MERKRTTWLWLLVVVATLALTATAFGGEAAKSDGSKEGIKVHGHWKIEIFNPDGTRASVHEFDNSVLTYGTQVLVEILTGDWTLGGWAMEWGGYAEADWPCAKAVDLSADSCKVGESGIYYGNNDSQIQDRTVQVSQGYDSTTQMHSIVLTGSIEASYAASIRYVYTKIAYCTNDITRADCRTNAPYMQLITGKQLSTPVPSVVPGQLIQVTVEISFS